jgi:hypothetical protein
VRLEAPALGDALGPEGAQVVDPVADEPVAVVGAPHHVGRQHGQHRIFSVAVVGFEQAPDVVDAGGDHGAFYPVALVQCKHL